MSAEAADLTLEHKKQENRVRFETELEVRARVMLHSSHTLTSLDNHSLCNAWPIPTTFNVRLCLPVMTPGR